MNIENEEPTMLDTRLRPVTTTEIVAHNVAAYALPLATLYLLVEAWRLRARRRRWARLP